MTAVAVFETEQKAAANEATLKEAMPNFSQFLDDADTTVDGRAVILQATLPTSEI